MIPSVGYASPAGRLHEQSIVLPMVPCMLCYVRDLLRSPAHFMLYSPVVCYEIHVKLAHTSARWIGTIAYRVDDDEMLLHISDPCSHA